MAPKNPLVPSSGEAANRGMTYRDAGVDIDVGDELVDDIARIVRSTRRPEVLAGVGGFGALVSIPRKYKQPILVSGTDGVGTKLKLGIEAGRVEGLGIDLVAMCVNDVLVSGAEPLFFLDYYATGHLDRKVAASVIKGIADGCRQAGCALVGGETAEMPGMYSHGDFDLAGFSVAVVEKSKIIDGRKVRKGDVLIALPSSGPHANGFSLVRRILSVSGAKLAHPFADRMLGDALLAPTTIYVKPILKLLAAGIPVHGMAHITGGGIPGNLPRCFPKGCGAVVDTKSWQRPAVFDWLQQAGNVESDEMWRVFNCGVGFVLIVPRPAVARAMASLKKSRLKPWILGEIVKGKQDVRFA
jgi:phosphoribosylformylglycinamidine cyclo-ligase